MIKKLLIGLLLVVFLVGGIGFPVTVDPGTKADLSQNETCSEYFARRLKEGWKVIEQVGYNVVLLSPDGTRRELDLRNDVLTLRPSATGDENSIPYDTPGIPNANHWQHVDEEIADETTTFLGVPGDDIYYRDLYNIPNHTTETGVINSITIYFRIYGMNSSYRAYGQPSQKTHGSVRDGSTQEQGAGWATKSQTYTLNPVTSTAYTWDEIDALQIGIDLKGHTGGGTYARCTQVYVEVDYIPLPGDPSNLSATTVSETQIDLTWTKGTGGDKTMVRRAEGDYPANPAAGDQAYFDTASAHSDTGLDPSTLYYYRAWAYDTEGAQYSSGYTSDTAATPGPPSVTTGEASSVEETIATLEGEITALNDGNATERGFDWDIDSGAPYAYDWYGEGSFGVEAFDHDLTGLTKGELYYYRAYAINEYGEGYGDEVKFLTKPDAPNTLAAAVAADDDIDLTWVNGGGSDTTFIVRKDGSYPEDREDGTNVYNGAAEEYHDDDGALVAGHIYYYKAWSYAAEGGESEYSELYDQVSIILTMGLELWFQPEDIIEDTVLVDRQGDYDGIITWGGRFADSGSVGTLTDSELTQDDDYWNGKTLKIKEVDEDAAPEGEEAEILDFTSATLGGTATSDGTTTTLIDTTLTQTTAYWAGTTVTIVTTTDSGAPQGESKVVTTWDLPTNTLTFPEMTAEVDENDTYTLTAADTLFFDDLTAIPGEGVRYEIWDGQKILWGSFPEGISVEVGALVASVDPVSGEVGGEDPEVAAVPQEPSGLWGGGATEDLPLYDLFNTVAEDLDWDTDVLYVFASIIVSVGLGVALLVTTGSTLAAIGGVGVGMAGGMATGMLPVWVLIVYLILGGTWLYVSRSI